MITTLVFDIGNVLINWDPECLYKKLIPNVRERQDFFRDVLPPEWNIEQDRGRSWVDAEAEQISIFPRHADLIRAFRARWHEMIAGAIDANVAVLTAAQAKGIPCYAITNFGRDTFAETQMRFPFLKTGFQGIVVSAHEGLIKPDPAIFEVFLARYAKSAAECLFMDDSAANIATAQSLGFSTVHVTADTNLRAEVLRHGFDLA